MAPTDMVQDPLVQVRPMVAGDVGEVLQLMRELARIEGYLERLAVTERDLLTHGFGPVPSFRAFVAAGHGRGGLCGLAVTYLIPWTYDLAPTVVLKELVVAPEARGQGVGEALLTGVAHYALDLDAPRVIWTVLADNDRAKAFYRRCGAQADGQWENWALDASAMQGLVTRAG